MKKIALVLAVVLASFLGGAAVQVFAPARVEAQVVRDGIPTVVPGTLTIAGATNTSTIVATGHIWMNGGGVNYLSQLHSTAPVSVRGGPSATNLFQVLTGTNVTRLLVSSTGLVRIGIGNTAALPTCDATIRGTIGYVEAAGGVKDTVAVCGKDAANAYAWRTIY